MKNQIQITELILVTIQHQMILVWAAIQMLVVAAWTLAVNLEEIQAAAVAAWIFMILDLIQMMI